MASAINIKNLSKIYRDTTDSKSPVEVLRDFNLEVEKGSFTVLHGPNGCGKSTLIHVLAGVEKFDSGVVSVLGTHPEKAHIGIVFQNYSATLFPWLKVADNICFVSKEWSIPKQDRIEKVKTFVRNLGFDEILNFLGQYPYKLSGGQQQMVSLTRSLFTEPPVIFFDEAFSALDAQNKDNALLGVQQFCKNRGITCLFSIHDLDEAILMADNLQILGSNPMQVRHNLIVNFERPRTTEIFKSSEFFELKKRVLEVKDK